MKNAVWATVVSLVLVACGGGGDPGSPATSELMSAKVSDRLESPGASGAKPASINPSLAPQPAARVNTTTAGQQALRSIGALGDGGYTVAWISAEITLYIQRYGSSGNKVGGETLIPLHAEPADEPSTAFRAINSSLAVLSDGSVVVAYISFSDVLQPDGAVLNQMGVYVQRFDASGRQILGETELASRVQRAHSRSPFFADARALALADGGFLVGWTDSHPSSVTGARNTFYNQRFDRWSQATTEPTVVGQPAGVFTSYRLFADARGGYVLSTFEIDPEHFPRDRVTVTHYDASQTPRQIVPPTPSPVLLLPLEGERYVLYATSSRGAYRQFLDSEGHQVGDPMPVSSMPAFARELADESFVVFWFGNGTDTAQRFDSTGAPMGELLTLQTHGAGHSAVPLAEGGFAAAWSTETAPGNLDVYTQRFVEILDRDQAARRVQRKACLDSAKGMKGRERKAFMDTCLA